MYWVLKKHPFLLCLTVLLQLVTLQSGISKQQFERKLMIKNIVKRSGKIEPFSPEKLNGWSEWAAKRLAPVVDWSEVVLYAMSTLPAEVSSQQLQETLIKFCVDKATWEHSLMAGRLYAALWRKQVYNNKIPTVKALHATLHSVGMMTTLNYSDEEYAQVEKIINHKLDYKCAHYELVQIRSKYALRNKVNKIEYETPQFVYMRMAMALAENEPIETRMHDVAKWYEHFSHKRINVPTPYYVNLGTYLNGYSSCCLYSVGDTWQSLAAGDHIAYAMTCMSAGIGSHIKTRSLKDPVRGGLIEHQGKLPYYRALVGAIGANLQNGRGGAATVHYSAYDPEVEVIQKLKNPMTPTAKQVRGCDYSFGSNKFLARKVVKDEMYAQFSYYTQPELHEAQYLADQTIFEKLYNEKVKSGELVENVSARQIVIGALNEAYETGRHYLHFTDEINRHTSFKEKIYSSNLCVAPETLVLTDNGYVEIKGLVDTTVNVWNGVEWSSVVVRKTGENVDLWKVSLSNGNSLVCTPYHKWYPLENNIETETRTHALHVGMTLASWNTPSGVEKTTTVTDIEKHYRVDDSYCLTEPKRNRVVFNGILSGNCQEVVQPTKPFTSIAQLYQPYDESHGELSICNLSAIIPSNIDSDDQYAEVAYYALKMIDVGIHKNKYIFQTLDHTAKARMNAGVGLMGLAHYMAKKNVKYSSQAGRDFIHELMETQTWHLYNASLKLGKEKGNAPWMHKTKFPEGWLPIDTYEKRVDQLVTVGYKRDWESLRKQIIENGGIRNSVTACQMPGESSSLSSGTTNGIYPIRDYDLIKTNDTNAMHYVVPDATKLRDKYEIAWDIDTQDLIKVYAIVQKWTDQAISADLYRKVVGTDRVGTTEMLDIYLSLVKYGIKTRYYQNSLTAKGLASNKPIETEQIIDDDPDPVCEGCSL